MKNIITLLYHEVADDAAESGFQNRDNLPYIHTVAHFRRDMALVRDFLDQSDHEIHLTFDDGGKSNLRAADILDEFGLKGTFFITTSKIGSEFFLNKDEVKQLAEKGHRVGSHSHTHPMIFKNLSYQKMLEEWLTSKEILEEILQKEVTICSVPGGDSDAKTYTSAEAAGFLEIYDSEPLATIRKLNKTYIYGRISIKNTVDEANFRKILSLEALPALQLKRKIKNTIKKIIFPVHNYLQNKKNGTRY